MYPISRRAPIGLAALTCAATLAITFSLAIAPLGAQVGKPVTIKDANTAAEADIAAMPHLNADLAKALVAARPFATVVAYDAFLASKLTKEQRAELFAKLWVHLDLNSATREEIALIPGMGPRMTREFLEYRPYASMAVFRREIAKYVSADEVARLEQYTFVPMNPTTASDEDLNTIPGFGPRMLREFKEYRPWTSKEQFRREIGKYVNTKEVARLERFLALP
jgi:DNA uptake protein ComE-like DNA-binding protein